MTKELKRNIAPEIKSIESVNIPSPTTYVLSNGTEVFVFEDKDQELLKIDFVFENAGTTYSPKPLVAGVTNAMITESTTNFSSKELADKIDYYGASFEAKSMKDYSSVSLYTLNKFLENLKGKLYSPLYKIKRNTSFSISIIIFVLAIQKALLRELFLEQNADTEFKNTNTNKMLKISGKDALANIYINYKYFYRIISSLASTEYTNFIKQLSEFTQFSVLDANINSNNISLNGYSYTWIQTP